MPDGCRQESANRNGVLAGLVGLPSCPVVLAVTKSDNEIECNDKTILYSHILKAIYFTQRSTFVPAYGDHVLTFARLVVGYAGWPLPSRFVDTSLQLFFDKVRWEAHQ